MYERTVLFFICVVCAVCAQDTSNCASQEKCNECIQQVGCVWCSEPYNSNIHCRSEKEVNQAWCPTNKLTNPQRSHQIFQNIDLNSGKQGDAVQIKPQGVGLRTRKGEETKISFQYAKAANYPVDLYYIMDLSASMKTHKNKLATLGGQLVQVMQSITTNFRLGFGSFVDKTLLPFTSTSPNKINNPCDNCVRAYSYKNHLSLTGNYDLFAQQVNAANVSGNLDAPEGGFDALMQAIVCQDVIGWRPNARHLIVFSTDAEFHVAGDGKLAGVVEPNDATCHVVNNEYIKALDLDYPSVSHLNYVAKENNINLIFAIVSKTDAIYRVYQTLQKNFENSGVGRLDEQSSNVVELVKENYNKIVDAVRITDNSTSTIEIKYHSTCKTPTENGCSNLLLDEVVNFTATIKPLECVQGHNVHRIQIKPEGVNEALMLDLEVVCNCDCEQSGSPDFTFNSTRCNGFGNEVCGVCDCHEGYFGSTCECNAESITSVDDANCRKDPNLPEVCSGLGTCKCGKCICEKRIGDQLIYGKFCECDNFSCKRVKGELCSGPEQGKCACGKCECLSGWIGEACDCRDTTATCTAPGSKGEICSGRGKCVCGECQCSSDEGKYSGKYCEECASCPGQRCQELQPCVECQAYKSGVYNENECLGNCTEFNTTIVDKIDENVEDENIKICRVIDNAGCTIVFKYTYDDEKRITVEALKDKACPEPIDIIVVVLSVIGSIVLGGLILLAIWKLVTHLHDGREYARFVAETENAKWVRGENPLYKGASTTFQNPTFKK